MKIGPVSVRRFIRPLNTTIPTSAPVQSRSAAARSDFAETNGLPTGLNIFSRAYTQGEFSLHPQSRIVLSQVMRVHREYCRNCNRPAVKSITPGACPISLATVAEMHQRLVSFRRISASDRLASPASPARKEDAGRLLLPR